MVLTKESNLVVHNQQQINNGNKNKIGAVFILFNYELNLKINKKRESSLLKFFQKKINHKQY